MSDHIVKVQEPPQQQKRCLNESSLYLDEANDINSSQDNSRVYLHPASNQAQSERD